MALFSDWLLLQNKKYGQGDCLRMPFAPLTVRIFNMVVRTSDRLQKARHFLKANNVQAL
jgi:hypothetical protein